MSNDANFLVSQEHKEQWKEMIPKPHRIKRVTANNFFASQYEIEEPCIVEGVDWACLEWTHTYLASILGSYEHCFKYENNETLRIPINEYISQVFEANNGNSRQIPSLPVPPSETESVPYARHVGPLTGKLNKDVEIESWFPPNELKNRTMRKFLFFGAASTKTNNHYDWSNNFVVCIQGIKHVCILPPKSEQTMTNITDSLRSKLSVGDCFYVPEPDSFELDICHPANSQEQNSVLHMHEHPVLEKCPGLVYSPLFPGDVVFFPAYWYHYFHNVTSTISVTIQS